MDTWFTTESVTKSILTEGLDVIGMVKQLSQRYNYKGISCTLPDTEIVRIYGNIWSIECFFKASKSFLKLGTDFRTASMMPCSATQQSYSSQYAFIQA